jgi:phenylacetate-CoA ligase
MHPLIAHHLVYRFIERCRGEYTTKVLAETKDIPLQPPETLQTLQYQKLENTIKTAGRLIPYYQSTFNAANIEIDSLDIREDMNKLPILSKKEVRTHPERFIYPARKSRTSREVTSGTSGQPLVVIKDRVKSAHIRATMFRFYQQYGISIGDRQARFWGVPSNNRDHVQERLKDSLANRVRLSAFNLSETEMNSFLKRLKRFKPAYFYGYPSVLARFAEWITESGKSVDGIDLSVIISTGEILYPLQRQQIQSTFRCSVADEYGTTEAGVLAFECPNGRMHINADHIFLEIHNPNNEGVGEILITELNNPYNPLIRYRVGDLAKRSNETCNCGNHFPLLENIQGRDSSFVVTPKGTYVNDAILEYILRKGIAKFQGIQTERQSLVIKIIKNRDFDSHLMTTYLNKLYSYLGEDMEIYIKFVDHIPADRSGKFRYFISPLLESKKNDPLSPLTEQKSRVSG